MPLYEYECKKCKHRFEEIRKFSDKQPKKCPKCGGPIEQVISAPAVQFKGSGWYVTDYAKKSGGASSASSSSDSSERESDSPGNDGKESKDDKGSKESKESKKDEKSKSESKSDSKSDDKPKTETAPKKKRN